MKKRFITELKQEKKKKNKREKENHGRGLPYPGHSDGLSAIVWKRHQLGQVHMVFPGLHPQRMFLEEFGMGTLSQQRGDL